MMRTLLVCLFALAAAEEAFVLSGKEGEYAHTIRVRAEGCEDPDKSGGCGVASIWLDGKKISTSGRGHNVVVFDPVTMDVLRKDSFDTYGSNSADDRLYNYINSIATGELVAIATQDEYTNRLAHGTLFDMMKRDFGCRKFDDRNGEYGKSGYRGSYAFLGFKRGDKLAERYAPRGMGSTEFTIGVPTHKVRANDMHIKVRSEGCNDPDKTVGCGIASVWVNGAQQSRRGRGHNIVVIDPVTGDITNQQKFDTYGSRNAQYDMRNFLNNVADGDLVIIATQDEYTRNFYDSDTFNILRRDFGAGMGDFPFESNYRSSWLLVAKKKGEMYANRFAPAGKGTTNWEMYIPKEESHSNQFSLRVRSEGCNDPDKTVGCGIASIWVNNQQRSPRRRGHNVVVINEEDGSVIKTADFDTHGDWNADNNMNTFLKNQVQDGQIVAISVQDEGTRTFESSSGVWNTLVRDFGALKPLEENYRSSWLLVAAKRGEVYAQRVAASGKGSTEVNLMIPLHAYVPPTPNPTKAPTAKPTKAPTAKPTKAPTAKPTKAPTANPTAACRMRCEITSSGLIEVTHDATSGHSQHRCFVNDEDDCVCECSDHDDADETAPVCQTTKIAGKFEKFDSGDANGCEHRDNYLYDYKGSDCVWTSNMNKFLSPHSFDGAFVKFETAEYGSMEDADFVQVELRFCAANQQDCTPFQKTVKLQDDILGWKWTTFTGAHRDGHFRTVDSSGNPTNPYPNGNSDWKNFKNEMNFHHDYVQIRVTLRSSHNYRERHILDNMEVYGACE